MENKVKFGLAKLAFAVATIAADGSATYGDVIMNPGAVSLSMEPQGELTPFRADNMDYYTSNDNRGYEGDVEVARFLDAVKAAIWSIATAGNGLKYEDADAEAVHFAMLFEFSGDKQKVRHVFYNCVATRPAVSSQTTGDTTEPQTETSTVTASPVYVAGLDKNVTKAKCYPGDAAYDTFYDAVTEPTASETTETPAGETNP